jgi:G3E family GTPase
MNPRMPERSNRARIPITVVGGPVGAGKTTLLRHLLEHNDKRHIAVVLDHPSALALDRSTISASTADAIHLHNGSVCVGLDGDIETALLQLQTRSVAPEHVLIEARAATDPARMSGYAYMPGFKPGGLVIVLRMPDVRTLNDLSLQGTPLQSQLAHAELLILNDAEAVRTSARPAVRQWLRARAERCRIVESDYGRVPPAFIVGPGGRLPPHVVLGAWTPAYAVAKQPKRHTQHQPRHDEDYRAWMLTSREPVEEYAFRRWVNALPNSILRGEGLLRLRAEPRQQFAFHLCGARWSLSRSETPFSGPLPSWISLIGLSHLGAGVVGQHGTGQRPG